MDFRGNRSSREQEEIARMREQLQRANQRVRFLEIENHRLRQDTERGYHRQEGSVVNYRSQLHLLVDDEEQCRGMVPGDPVQELPDLEEAFNWDNYVLLDGDEEEKMMQPEKEDTSVQEEDIEKEKSHPTDEGRCFCGRMIISEGDESEHYRHCPEYNRWSGSENNSFYSPQYCSSSYSSNHSPSTTRDVPHGNRLLDRRSY